MQLTFNERKGDYIGTYTGKKFYPLDPRKEDICLEDIAHALSRINRFNGHTISAYTVADHCINVERYLEFIGANIKVRLHGLLHDASEAYICDIPRPLKSMIPIYKEMEKKIQAVILNCFTAGELTHWEEALIKYADDYMLAVEAKEHMNNSSEWDLMNVCSFVTAPSYRRAEKLFIKKTIYLMKNNQTTNDNAGV